MYRKVLNIMIRKIGFENDCIQIILGMLITCGGPMLVSAVTKKIKIFDICFYPYKHMS